MVEGEKLDPGSKSHASESKRKVDILAVVLFLRRQIIRTSPCKEEKILTNN